jgi:AraC-like DNA-binding protein
MNNLGGNMTNTTAPKPFVFVLMPFDKEFDDVYKLGIKPACKNAGAYAERVDEQLFQDSILDRIYNQIAKADIIISDMTGKNPNVFYESGYAHALGKAVILITNNGEDIPFDLKHYPHIIYEGSIADLIPEIERRVKYLIDEPSQITIFESAIEYYIDGNNLADEPTIDYMEEGHGGLSRLKLQFDAYNSIEHTIKTQSFKLGFQTSSTFDQCRTFSKMSGMTIDATTVKKSDNSFIHILDDTIEIWPGAWKSSTIEFLTGVIEKRMSYDDEEKIALIMLTKNGVQSFPFKIKYKEKPQVKTPDLPFNDLGQGHPH